MRKTLNAAQNNSQEPCQGVCLSRALHCRLLTLPPASPCLLPVPLLTSVNTSCSHSALLATSKPGGLPPFPQEDRSEFFSLPHTPKLFPLQAFWTPLIVSLGKEPERRSHSPAWVPVNCSRTFLWHRVPCPP